ncbi:MAG: hypothetical protein WBV82_02360 [Myxococcaceae bacterium]
MSKRLLVDCLSRDALLEAARMLELSVHSRMAVADFRERFARSRRVTAEDILEVLQKDDLKSLWQVGARARVRHPGPRQRR